MHIICGNLVPTAKKTHALYIMKGKHRSLVRKSNVTYKYIVCVRSALFWVIKQRQVVIYYRRFRRIFRSLHQAAEWLVFVTEI